MNPNPLTEYLEPGKPWGGHRMYQCRLCVFNCLRIEKAMEHVRVIHFAGKVPGQKRTVQTRIVDAEGRPLTMEVKDGRTNNRRSSF